MPNSLGKTAKRAYITNSDTVAIIRHVSVMHGLIKWDPFIGVWRDWVWEVHCTILYHALNPMVHENWMNNKISILRVKHSVSIS